MDTIVAKNGKTVQPFLKWAGGKRWLTSLHNNLFPQAYSKYFEPFLGSGAVFFSLRPVHACLGDRNKDLIDCYTAIQKNWVKVESLLRSHHVAHSQDYYYKVRAHSSEDLAERAARFIYLNRTCWNGLYRVNRYGQFNVPKGTKKNVLLNTDDFETVAQFLENVDLKHGDFEPLINQAQAGDFIFVDPPYTVKHNYNGFVKYNETMFQWSDQVRLSECLIKAHKRGCLILATNASHSSVAELYKDNFELISMTRPSVIAASSENRGIFEELAIKNY